jgi:hypothetical protein
VHSACLGWPSQKAAAARPAWSIRLLEANETWLRCGQVPRIAGVLRNCFLTANSTDMDQDSSQTPKLSFHTTPLTEGTKSQGNFAKAPRQPYSQPRPSGPKCPYLAQLRPAVPHHHRTPRKQHGGVFPAPPQTKKRHHLPPRACSG